MCNDDDIADNNNIGAVCFAWSIYQYLYHKLCGSLQIESGILFETIIENMKNALHNAPLSYYLTMLKNSPQPLTQVGDRESDIRLSLKKQLLKVRK